MSSFWKRRATASALKYSLWFSVYKKVACKVAKMMNVRYVLSDHSLISVQKSYWQQRVLIVSTSCSLMLTKQTTTLTTSLGWNFCALGVSLPSTMWVYILGSSVPWLVFPYIVSAAVTLVRHLSQVEEKIVYTNSEMCSEKKLRNRWQRPRSFTIA